MEANAIALTRFVETERPKLVNYVRKWLKDAAERDAEDIIQDVTLSFFDGGDPARPITNIAAYVYQSLRNRIVDNYRKKKGNVVHFEDMAEEMDGHSLDEILADVRFDTHNAAEQNEIREKIFRSIDRLKPEQKAVFIATEIDDFSFQELSILWQEPMGTLLARKHRAVKALQKSLEGLKRDYHID